MRRALLMLVLAACAGMEGYEYYDNNDLELLTAYRAKELCSCLFVMEQTEDYCAEWTVASPNLATFQIDYRKKVVQTEALFMWGARAHLVSEHFGCILDK